jgi:hypothetical protein
MHAATRSTQRDGAPGTHFRRRSCGLMEIENLIRYPALAVGLMEIEN